MLPGARLDLAFFFHIYVFHIHVINHWHTCTVRVTVLGLCVSLSVYLSVCVRLYLSDTVSLYVVETMASMQHGADFNKKRFFYKHFIQKLWHHLQSSAVTFHTLYRLNAIWNTTRRFLFFAVYLFLKIFFIPPVTHN